MLYSESAPIYLSTDNIAEDPAPLVLLLDKVLFGKDSSTRITRYLFSFTRWIRAGVADPAMIRVFSSYQKRDSEPWVGVSLLAKNMKRHLRQGKGRGTWFWNHKLFYSLGNHQCMDSQGHSRVQILFYRQNRASEGLSAKKRRSII